MLLYEPDSEDPNDMHYHVREKLLKNLECDLIVITAYNVLICQDCRLTSLNYKGIKEREWNFDTAIHYIRVIGGPPSREGVLVGLKSGQVLEIFIDNAFPIEVVKVPGSVCCLDISVYRDRLAVIDDTNTLYAYCLKTGQMLFQAAAPQGAAAHSLGITGLCHSKS
ncbi:unnamed protein product [Protopolystoma xenopodis]|uniref:IFT122 second beta-propeller domain-containing protein n=1 Tax=Protopolystoma xenopodis TaxID=117903 RepID=A0A448XG45_9PLAT|nr:unnamed protein product [Protopolystoma xenopodis]